MLNLNIFTLSLPETSILIQAKRHFLHLVLVFGKNKTNLWSNFVIYICFSLILIKNWSFSKNEILVM